MLHIVVTDPAQADILAAFEWWHEQRSIEQAQRWYRSIYVVIQGLKTSAPRCPAAPERDLVPTGLFQLTFGVGRRRTHRIVFTIVRSDVIILRVRHAAQEALTEDDLN
jgi:plasmid stabilization system protein ParE